MPSPDIICPACLTPAVKWFEFGGKADPHAYYHCETCGRSCAVRQASDGRPGHSSAWVHEAARERVPSRSVLLQG